MMLLASNLSIKKGQCHHCPLREEKCNAWRSTPIKPSIACRLASVLRRKRLGNQIQFRFPELKKQYEIQKALKSYFTHQADDQKHRGYSSPDKNHPGTAFEGMALITGP
jgi:hypothetical protein